MSRRIAFVYPGQGSQFVGMGRDLAEASGSAAKLFAGANEILGRDLTSIMFSGPEEELRQTVNTQPALLLVSAAAHELVAQHGLTPSIVAGHSLGEYSALVGAGVLDFETALKLVKLRAELMQQAGTANPGAMAAVIGLDDEKVTAICAETGDAVVVANYNAPGQVVISGKADVVPTLFDKLKQAGAKRVLPLPVSGAFHSPLMADAAVAMSQAIEDAAMSEPRVPLVSNADGQVHTSAAEIRENLKRQIRSAVRWTQSVQSMRAWGAETFVEVGAGKVLAGLIKRIDKSVTTCNAGAKTEIDALALEPTQG